MRILLAGSYYSDVRQGSPKLLLRLGTEFQRFGHTVDYLFLDALPRWAQPYRVSWFLLPLVVLGKVLGAKKEGRPYDVVDVSGGDAWLVGLLKRRFRLGCTLICRSHGWEHEDYRVRVRGNSASSWDMWKRGLLMRLVRLPMVEISAKTSDAIIVGSSPVQEFAVYKGWKKREHIFVVPCGLDPEYFVRNDTEKGRGVLYVGSWIRRKGISYLAKAYELVRKRGHYIPLSIVGHGQTAEEILKVFNPDLKDGLRICERLRLLDEQTLIKEYESHDMLVFPSIYEGFGMVFLEAMASGLPVIATPVGGVVDIIRHGENGIIVPSKDAEALAQAAVDLWESPEKRRRLGEAARETARLYTWDKIALRTLQCYQAVLEGRG